MSCPAIKRLPRRVGPVLALTVKVTLPLPCAEAGEVRKINASLLATE